MKSYSVSISATVIENQWLSVCAEDEEDLKRKIKAGDIDEIMDESECSTEYDIDTLEINDVCDCYEDDDDDDDDDDEDD